MARPRDSRIDVRILEAARAIVEESGYDGLTMHAVAQRAGVGHPALYRRYRNRNDLAMALSVGSSVPPELPDTGSFAADLEIVEQALVGSLLATPRSIIGPQIGTMIADRQVSETLRGELMDRADALLAPLWARAVERGEVNASLDGVAALRGFSYAVVINLLVMHRDPEGPWRHQNREVFLRGVRPDR